jgi:hypothetical protein
MAVKATLLVLGEATPREIYITRSIAVRVFCDCHKHSLKREAWTFIIALDRDTGDSYVRRGDALDSEPWRRSDSWGPLELEVCKTRFEIDGVTNLPQPVDENGHVIGMPWYGEAPHAQLKYQKPKDDEQESDFELAKREGLVDGYERDAPKESDAKRRRRERKKADHAQPMFGGIDLEPPAEAVHGSNNANGNKDG